MRQARSLIVIALGAAAVLASPQPAPAAPNGPAEKSLDRCQSTVRTEGAKYVQGMQKAIGVCLGKIAGEVLKKNSPSVAAAVAACTTQFDKLARTDGRSLGDAFRAKVTARCSPAPANPHTLQDLLGGASPSVDEPLEVQSKLRFLCQRYGVEGNVDSASKWVECVKAAQECAVHDAIAAQFPRAIEWLDDLAEAMPPSPARDAVRARQAAIDGTPEDGVPDGDCSVEILPAGCSESLLSRPPHVVVADLLAALAAGDWDAAACNYHPHAFVIDDQGAHIGPQEIVDGLESLYTFAGGALPVVQEENIFRGMVRILFALDAGWWRIEDGVWTVVVRRGRIVQQSTHGLIEFTGPPPE